MQVRFKNLGHAAKVFLAFGYAQGIAKFSPDKRLGVGCTAFNTETGKILHSTFNSKPYTSKAYLECVNPVTDSSHEDLLHAEVKMALELGIQYSSQNAAIVVTTAPCRRCAGILAQISMKNIYFLGEHDRNEGIRILTQDYNIDAIDCTVLTKELQQFATELDSELNNFRGANNIHRQIEFTKKFIIDKLDIKGYIDDLSDYKYDCTMSNINFETVVLP